MKLFNQIYQLFTHSDFFNFIIFSLLIIFSILIGQYIAKIIHLILFLFFRRQRREIYHDLIRLNQNKINRRGTWILLYLSWCWLEDKETVLLGLDFVIDLIFTIFMIWIIARTFRQLNKVYGIKLFGKIGGETTEILLAIETIFNIVIGLIAITIFAYQHGIPLTGLLAGASIGGIALSFAAQNTLQQLFGTVILFLDKPFIQGEYIRLPDETFGRVESIGLRSTKIRTVAKNTLLIVPNSKMADWQIENITRGKKVMILVYLDFDRLLDEYEKSLVKQIVDKYINSFFGIEPDTSSTTFLTHTEHQASRARIIFFILGSTQSSIELRSRMIAISEKQLYEELRRYGINFTANEPVISVDSPVTL